MGTEVEIVCYRFENVTGQSGMLEEESKVKKYRRVLYKIVFLKHNSPAAIV